MIKYFLHDGRTFICPHYAGSSDLHQMLDFAREAGVDAMNKAGTSTPSMASRSTTGKAVY